MAYQISASQITPDTTHLMRGKVLYNRIVSLIQGEELSKRSQANAYSPTLPHTSISVAHAEIIPASGDINQLSREEIFFHERRYRQKDAKAAAENGLVYSIDNKTNRLPQIWVIDPESGPNHYRQVENPQGDLEAGLDVTLVLDIYNAKGQTNRGVTLRAVLVNEPIRYRTTAGIGINVNRLRDRGLILTGTPRQLVANDTLADGTMTDAFGRPVTEGGADTTNVDAAAASNAAGNTATTPAPVMTPAPQMQAPVAQAAQAQPQAVPAQPQAAQAQPEYQPQAAQAAQAQPPAPQEYQQSYQPEYQQPQASAFDPGYEQQAQAPAQPEYQPQAVPAQPQDSASPWPVHEDTTRPGVVYQG